MNRYRVTWLLQDGAKVTEEYEADDYKFLPNGPAVFVKALATTTINLVGKTGEQSEQTGEIVVTVVGFNVIEKL